VLFVLLKCIKPCAVPTKELHLPALVICNHDFGRCLPGYLRHLPAILPHLIDQVPKALIWDQCSAGNAQQPFQLVTKFWISIAAEATDKLGMEMQRLVSSMKATPTMWCLWPEMAPKTIDKKPSTFMMCKRGELTTTQIWGPASFPCPIPAISAAHLVLFANQLESP